MKKDSIVILGAGLSGIAAATHLFDLGIKPRIYDKDKTAGGHAKSHFVAGFTFDEGPHVSFTKSEYIKDLFAKSVKNNYLQHKAEIMNFWKGHLVPHPVLANLIALPKDIAKILLLELKDLKSGDLKRLKKYSNWCIHGMGETFSKEFAFKYTRKYWTTEASNLTTDWVGSRISIPTYEEALRGSKSRQRNLLHYLTDFRYPKNGGFGSYALGLAKNLKIDFGNKISLVDLKRKEIIFSNGKKTYYERLISSIPLPELISSIKDVPRKIKEAVELLNCSSVVLVNIGLKRADEFPRAHWMYYYDEDIIFSRLHFPHKLSVNNTPSGCGSIQVEVYHSRYKPLSCEDIISKTVEDLYKVKLLRKRDTICLLQQINVKYANVIFDHKRANALGIIKEYLNSHKIVCCGRYGEWEYYWTDDAVLSGRRAAENISHSI